MIRETLEKLDASAKEIDHTEAGKLKKATILSNDEPEADAAKETADEAGK